jgi:hypothetical protein
MKLFLLLLLLPFASASYEELKSDGDSGYCYQNGNGVVPSSTSTTEDLNACAVRCGGSTMMTAHGGFFIHNGAACICGHSDYPSECTNWQSVPDGDTSYKSYKISSTDYEELQSGYCNDIAASEATTDTTVQQCYDRCLPLYYGYFIHSTSGQTTGAGACLCGHTTDPDDCSDWESSDAFTSYKILDPTPAPASPGCTDSGASNYDADATEDDGSCTCGAGKGMEGGVCVACNVGDYKYSDVTDNSACKTQGTQNCPQGQRFVSGGNSAPNQCTPCGQGT